MSASPNFSALARSSTATLSAGNTARDGSGTIVTVIEAGTGGTRIDAIMIAATATTAAGTVKLYVSPTNAANTTANTHLIREVLVTAITPSATTAAFNASLTSATNPELLPIFLPAGHTLRADTTVAQGFRVTASGGDF